MSDDYNWSALQQPLPAREIEWRVLRAGKSKSGKIWCIPSAYVTNRGVMRMLDTHFGPANWRNEYKLLENGGMLCGISVRLKNGEWITKWDGAGPLEAPDPDMNVKGQLSNAMKRAAVQWGIGRYLYDIGNTFAEIVSSNKPGAIKAKLSPKHGGDTYYYLPPKIPTADDSMDFETGEIHEDHEELQDALSDAVKATSILSEKIGSGTYKDKTWLQAVVSHTDWVRKYYNDEEHFPNLTDAERDVIKLALQTS